MSQNENKKTSLRVLIMITAPKLLKKAEKLISTSDVLLHYVLNGIGTASNEMLDILGLGTPDKSIVIMALSKPDADKMMRRMYFK